MKIKSCVFVITALFFTWMLFAAGCKPGKKPDDDTVIDRVIEVSLASEELKGDFMTVWAEKFADHMDEWSGGKFKLNVYPYGTLGSARDINELAQMGQVEYVFSDFAWVSAFVPEAAVFGLHYVWPEENLPEVIEWVVKNGKTMKILEESYRREGLVPLSIMFEGWQWITSNDPIESVEDMKGFDVRIMESSMLNQQYLRYGASPNSIAYGEVYSNLDTGAIDGQINPLFAIRSMGFYEVQDYFTQIYAEPFIGIPTANRAYFDSLPAEIQEEHRRWWAEAVIPSAEWIKKRHEKDLKYMKKKRPQIKITEITGDAREQFRERAGEAVEIFLRQGGANAERIYSALLSDIKQAQTELGLN